MKPISFRLRPIRWCRIAWTLALWSALSATVRAEEPSAFDQARSSYQTKLESLWARHLGEEQAAAASNRYCKLLADCVEAYRARGGLEGYRATKNELKRYCATGTVEAGDLATDHPPIERVQRAFLHALAANQRKLQESEVRLAQAYLQHLEKVKADLIRHNQIDQTVAVEQEIETVRATLPQDARGAPRAESRASPPAAPAPPPLPAILRRPIPDKQLFVYATDDKGPVAGLDVTLKSHTFSKTFTAQTDRDGVADFAILPELEYRIVILDPRYEPVIRDHGKGGMVHAVELDPMPEGIQFLELGIVGEIRLPGISPFNIGGSYGTVEGKGGVILRPTSTRTVFNGIPAGQDMVRLDHDHWTTVSERDRRVEFKVLVPAQDLRIVLYRILPPNPSSGAGPSTALSVQTTREGKPAQNVEVVLTSRADGTSQSRKTDRHGKAEFTVDPIPEYVLHVADKRFLPVVKPHCIGGESHALELAPMPQGTTMTTLGRAGEVKLPGMSPLQVFGHSVTAGMIQGVALKATSIKTTFAGHPPGTDRVSLKTGEWLSVAEGSRRYDLQFLAPSADLRIILYRRTP